jgi:hypothetical protein
LSCAAAGRQHQRPPNGPLPPTREMRPNDSVPYSPNPPPLGRFNAGRGLEILPSAVRTPGTGSFRTPNHPPPIGFLACHRRTSADTVSSEVTSDLNIAKAAFELARSIIRGETSVILGSRRLASLAHELVSDWRTDEDFVVFGALASESDHLPTGAERPYWSESSLAREDQNIARLEARWRAPVLQACRSVIERFSPMLAGP